MTTAGEGLPGTPDLARLAQSVAEARQLLAAFDNTRPQDMGPLFYAHAYGELDLALRDLLDQLAPRPDERDPSGAAEARPTSGPAAEPEGEAVA